MPRPLRDQEPGIYHLTANGVRHTALFRDDADRVSWLEHLPELCDRYRWTCVAYCAMTTHYHLLVRTRLPNLARGMQWLNGTWGARFNRRHGEVGHVLRRRYSSAKVESEAHLLEAGRYIALNPVHAGACLDPLDWPWSSYAAAVGREPHGAWLDATPVHPRRRAVRPRRGSPRQVPRLRGEDDRQLALRLGELELAAELDR